MVTPATGSLKTIDANFMCYEVMILKHSVPAVLEPDFIVIDSDNEPEEAGPPTLISSDSEQSDDIDALELNIIEDSAESSDAQVPNSQDDQGFRHNAAKVTPENACIICRTRKKNSTLYRCGHTSLCYRCAKKQWKSRRNGGGKCPICRGIIFDVIKTYQ